ncbi:uncharacterized protein [Pituophis catenifer annectens]|uniref:uncharacterized protein n=1 Tax=Pituophis catenifer annectens TaxID=94852 RepID=UPI00399314C4
MNQAVQHLLQIHAIEEVPHDQWKQGYYSILFVVPKRSGGWRAILDLKNLNSYIVYRRFKMCSLTSILQGIRPNDFLVSIDLMEAYLHIPILPKHRQYLRFSYAGKHFQYRALPFGLASAPRVFTKVLAVVAAHLRQQPNSISSIGHSIQALRQDGLLRPDRPMGTPSRSPLAVVPASFSKETPSSHHVNSQSSTLSQAIARLVDIAFSRQGVSFHESRPTCTHYRRQPSRMGGSSCITRGSGPLVCIRPRQLYQLAGAEGHSSRSHALSPVRATPSCSGVDRQYSGEGTCQPSRGHPLKAPHGGIISPGQVGRTTPPLHQSGPHCGVGKHTGGFPEQDRGGQQRVADSSRHISSDLQQVRHPSHRSLRHTPEQSASSLLLEVPDARGGRGQRSPSHLAAGSSLCLSTAASDSGPDSEDHRRQSRNYPRGSPLATPSVVRRPGQSLHISPLENSTRRDCPASGEPSSSGPSVAPTDCMALEGARLRQDNYSDRVIHIVQACRRKSTVRLYNISWLAFYRWCRSRQIDPVSASPAQILEFLRDGFDRGLAHSTLRRHVAALSTALSSPSGRPLTQHPVIKKFLRGARLLRPSSIHRYPTWDLPKVLNALTETPFEPLRTVHLRFLTLKVVFLIAITSARRISELAALSVREDLCVFRPDTVILRLDPSFIPKVNSPFHRAQEVILPNFCPRPSHALERRWHTLDVRRALKIYIKRTAPFRKSEALFVSFLPGSLGLKVSSATIGRWIRACIASAYQAQAIPVPNSITAHSTRSAATSAAWATQASLEEVCRAATWSTPSPFIRHYKIDTFASAEASFGRRVLQQVHRARVSPGPSTSRP